MSSPTPKKRSSHPTDDESQAKKAKLPDAPRMRIRWADLRAQHIVHENLCNHLTRKETDAIDWKSVTEFWVFLANDIIEYYRTKEEPTPFMTMDWTEDGFDLTRATLNSVADRRKVAYLQVLGEENASNRAYVIDVEDLPGGDLTILKQELAKRGRNARQWYHKGEPITNEQWKELWAAPGHSEVEFAGDIIDGFLAFKALYTFDQMDQHYEPKSNEDVVYCVPVFENI